MRALKDIPMSELGFDANSLAGEVAVITGAARGIGKELAHILAQLGASVVIADISADGQSVVDDVLLKGRAAMFVKTDVSSEESVVSMLEACADHLGAPTILVNNALICPVKPLVEMTSGEWESVTSVNLKGAFLCIRGVLPGMTGRRHGCIVNMISAPSMPYAAAYAATKQALESLAHSVAGEVEGSGISVIAYGPGMVETPGGNTAFHALTSYLGVTYEQMSHSGINQGYEGLIPAYDSALSLAYIICHAADYHNETVMMHDPLPKFVPAEFADKDAETVALAVSPIGTEATPTTPVALIDFLLEKASMIESMLEATEAEFMKLPFFARPMARGGLKKKAGMSSTDIRAMIRSLSEALAIAKKALQDGSDSAWPKAKTRFLATWQRAPAVLSGLAAYYNEVPSEMARFVKDEKVLAETVRVCEKREKTAKALAAHLASSA